MSLYVFTGSVQSREEAFFLGQKIAPKGKLLTGAVRCVAVARKGANARARRPNTSAETQKIKQKKRDCERVTASYYDIGRVCVCSKNSKNHELKPRIFGTNFFKICSVFQKPALFSNCFNVCTTRNVVQADTVEVGY